jgi:hypothetical protein
MSRHNQILSGTTVRNLTFSSGNSTSVQLGGSGTAVTYGGVTFLVNFNGTSASSIRVEQSSDNTTWGNMTVGYQTSTTFGAPITVAPANPSGNITASATPSASGQFLAISVNRQGRETSPANLTVPLTPATPTYLRVVAATNSANATYCVALLYNPSITPVPQPDVAIEVKGTN